MSALIQDVRFSLRLMRRQRAIPIVAALTLALGIGANTVMFSAASGILFTPLPFPDPDRIVIAWRADPQRGIVLPSPAEFSEWRLRSQCFEQLSAWRTRFVDVGSAQPERVWGVKTSPSFFDLLHARVALGRTYSEHDKAATRESEVVISYRLWRERFAAIQPSLDA